MKAKISVIFLLLASLAGSNPSQPQVVIEYGLIVWESEIIRGISINQAYAQIMPSSAAYFNGKAAAYAELLDRLYAKD